jgi:hypothetical protein
MRIRHQMAIAVERRLDGGWPSCAWMYFGCAP